MTEAEIIEALGAASRVCPMSTITFPVPGGRREATESVYVAPTALAVEELYVKLIKTRLAWVGKDPDDFVLGDRPWGDAVADSPFIAHHDKLYLPVIVNEVITERFYIGEAEVPRHLFPLKDGRRNQGLPKELEVRFHNYKVEDIRHMGGQGI